MGNANFHIGRLSLVLGTWLGGNGFSQPAAPAGANAACFTGTVISDTIPGTPDAEGFLPLFNGVDFKGWWESCESDHSGPDKTYGGTWLVHAGEKAIYSQQNANGAGSILMTKRQFMNYEIQFDHWPSFTNDAGLFNRTTSNGKCYQTVLDYIGGSSVGGVYGEGGYANRNIDPYVFGANENTISSATAWTTYTAKQNPASFGCPVTGCTPANWTTIWDVNGWNQVRVKFYGTGNSATNLVHMQSFVRKIVNPSAPPPNNWVPIIHDSVQIATPPGYIGFQIHQGTGRWGGQSGTWYRNIKWIPLTDQGVRIMPLTVMGSGMRSYASFKSTATELVGFVSRRYAISISDVSGRVIEKFSGPAGEVHHTFSTEARGLLLVKVKTDRSEEYFRVSRLFN